MKSDGTTLRDAEHRAAWHRELLDVMDQADQAIDALKVEVDMNQKTLDDRTPAFNALEAMIKNKAENVQEIERRKEWHDRNVQEIERRKKP